MTTHGQWAAGDPQGQATSGYPIPAQQQHGLAQPAYGHNGQAAYGAPAQGLPPQGDMSGALFRAQSEYEESRKSVGLAYLLWFFLGAFGGHRFYLRQTGTAIAMLILGLTFFGLVISGIWALVDAFLIPGIAARVNAGLRRDAYARYRVPLY